MRRRRRRAASTIALALFAAILLGGTAAAQAASSPGMQLAQKSSPSTRTQTTKKGTAKTRSGTAVTKEQRVWKFSRSAGIPTLQFGRASGHDVLLSFSCHLESGLLRVISLIGSRGLRPGDGAPIRLSNGKTRFEIAGTAFSTESTDAVDIGGATRIDPKLFALFRAGDTLRVDVPGRRRALPVAAIGANADAFEKACLGED